MQLQQKKKYNLTRLSFHSTLIKQRNFITHTIFSKITYEVISVTFTCEGACIFARLSQRLLDDLFVVVRSVTGELVTTQSNTARSKFNSCKYNNPSYIEETKSDLETAGTLTYFEATTLCVLI